MNCGRIESCAVRVEYVISDECVLRDVGVIYLISNQGSKIWDIFKIIEWKHYRKTAAIERRKYFTFLHIDSYSPGWGLIILNQFLTTIYMFNCLSKLLEMLAY